MDSSHWPHKIELYAAHLRGMTEIKRVSTGVPTGGQFAANQRPEAQVDLDVAYSFHDSVTADFESAVESFEKQVDDRIVDMVTKHFADGPDGLTPAAAYFEFDDESNNLELVEVHAADGTPLFDLEEHEEHEVLAEAVSLVASYYPNAGFGHTITFDTPDPVADLAAADAAVEAAQARRQEAVVRGLAASIHERFEYATNVLLSPDEKPVVEAICDSEGASLWDFMQERVDLNDDEADEYQQELAEWSTRIDLRRLDLKPHTETGYVILPITGATK